MDAWKSRFLLAAALTEDSSWTLTLRVTKKDRKQDAYATLCRSLFLERLHRPMSGGAAFGDQTLRFAEVEPGDITNIGAYDHVSIAECVTPHQSLTDVVNSHHHLQRRLALGDLRVVLADINSDGTADIFIGSDAGTVVCLDGRQGGAVWNTSLGASIQASPLLTDLNGDGKVDAVIGAEDCRIHALSGTDGRPIWVHVGTHRPSTAAAGDMNGDGVPDMAILTTEELIVLEGRKGAALWRWPLPSTAKPDSDQAFRTIPPAIADLDGDSVLDVIVTTSGGHVYAVG